MDEFIVWDEKNKVFSGGHSFRIDADGDVFHEGTHHLDKDFKPIHKAFKHFGLQDINSKKIYADCSTVEFYLTLSHEEKSKIGFISFNKETLCYEVLVEDGYGGYNKYNFIDYEIRNIKTIDTIQENKLGLI